MLRYCVSVMLKQSLGLNENLIKFTQTLIYLVFHFEGIVIDI